MESMIEEIARKNNLPVYATRERLERRGARYVTTEPFQNNGRTLTIEYMLLEQNGECYTWKRIPQERKQFKIHLKAAMIIR